MKHWCSSRSLYFFGLIALLGLIFSSACTPILTAETTSTNNVSDLWEGHANKIEVIYFHATQQCITCQCFEKHISSIMTDNFSKQINQGVITYKILNYQDPANNDLVAKYQVVTSSLCIDRIVNGTHKYLNIQDIWYWNCTGLTTYFDQKIVDVINKALN